MSGGRLNKVAIRFTDLAERYVPDAFVFALIGTIIVFLLGFFVADASVAQLVESWGMGFWQLLPFSMQMALIIITGYVLATAKPVFRIIQKLAAIPKTGRGAAVFVAVFAMLTSWLNWGFSLIFSAVLVKEIAKRKRDVDYRALAACSFLGLGSVWAQGLSSSAALQMTTENALQPAVREIVARGGFIQNGLIPLTNTIFLWQSFVSVFVEIFVVALVVWFVVPTKSSFAVPLAVKSETEEDTDVKKSSFFERPGEWFEHTPVLNLIVSGLGFIYIYLHFSKAPDVLAAINLDIINLIFLILGFLLHWTPARFMKAFREATPAVWGVILQFPFYAGIAGIIVTTGLNDKIAHLFVSLSNQTTFPTIIAIYSAVLGVFVPSGGSKWVIEAPYVMSAAHDLKVHLGWTVSVYNLGEAIANLIQPFWMLPTLALLHLKARDVMGYTFIVFLALTPVVLVLVTVLALTLNYPL